ncbi:MAG: hypothetical protein ABIS21_01685, partial [Acidimicrobiales bacterium]
APEVVAGEVSPKASERYRTEWERLSTNSTYRLYARLLVRRFEQEANRHGYSMREFSQPSRARSPKE